MNKYILPISTTIDDIECKFNTDFRDILKILKALSDPDLVDIEKIMVALNLFYVDTNYNKNVKLAITEMYSFINMQDDIKENTTSDTKPLYDWEQDFNIIIAPINKILGYDCRSKEYLHWWTFLSAFMDIGECTFSTYVSIRDKLNHSRKLEKYEKRLLQENRDAIILKKKVDSTTQSIMDEILGV